MQYLTIKRVMCHCRRREKFGSATYHSSKMRVYNELVVKKMKFRSQSIAAVNVT